MWSTGCCVSAFRMSFSGVWGVFIPRTLNKKKTPGAPDWEQLFQISQTAFCFSPWINYAFFFVPNDSAKR